MYEGLQWTVDVISVQITEIINTWLWCLAGLMESEGNARQQNDQSQVLCNHQYIPANMKHSLTVGTSVADSGPTLKQQWFIV